MSELYTEYRKFKNQPLIWIGLIFLLFIITETAFDVVEQAVGNYLKWHNPHRQKIGRSWKEDRSRLQANSNLETLTRISREKISEIEKITDIEGLLSYIESHPRTLLPIAQFSKVYHKIPMIFRAWLVAPNDLINYRQETDITNVLVSRQENQIDFFLLTTESDIVHQASLANEQVTMIRQHGKERRLDVRSTQRFSQYIIEAAKFYETLDKQFFDDRENLIRTLPILTDLNQKIVRVAFANNITEGFIETAFAIDDFRALIYYLPEELTIDFTSRPQKHEGWYNF